MDYYKLAIGAYKKWKSYICSTSNSMFAQKIKMNKFEKENDFSSQKIEKRIKEYVDELLNDDLGKLTNELKNMVVVEPKTSQIYSYDSREICVKKSFMLSCVVDVKYYIYDMMYTLIILQGIRNNNSQLFNNKFSYSNKIAVDDLFDNNGQLNLSNNSLFIKYMHNYNKWQDEAKKEINNLIANKEESFIISYFDFKNFYYNIPFNAIKISQYFSEEDYKLFQLVNIMRDKFCIGSRKFLNNDCAVKDTFLPIGLISSMVLSEIYMYNFDLKVNTIRKISYYGRYCDDIIFIYKDYDEYFIDSFESIFTFTDTLSVKSIEIEGYKQLIPNEKSHSEINVETDTNANDNAYIFLGPSLIGEYKKLSLKEIDLKDFIAGEDGVPDDPVNSIINDIYNYLMYGGDSSEYRRLAFKLEKIISDHDKLLLMCTRLETCYILLSNKDNKYKVINKEIDTILSKIDYISNIDISKCILNIKGIKDLNRLVIDALKAYNYVAYKRACAVKGETNDWYYSFCYPVWFCDKVIERYCSSYSNAVTNLKFFPYNIGISDIYFANIIDFSCSTIDELYEKYEKLFKYYFILNGYKDDKKYVEIINDSVIPYIKFNLSDKNKEKVFAGVANIDYEVSFDDNNKKDLNKDFFKNVNFIKNTITEFKKVRPYNTLKYLIFPELYLNPYILVKLAKISKSLKISLIGGCKYIINDQMAKNEVANLIYFQIGSFNQCLPIIRLKNEYAPKEVEKLTEAKKDFISGNNVYYVIDDGFSVHATMYCYELTDIKVRSFIKGVVNLLIASEYNTDTFYFSNIIESVVRDITCYALQANVSRYGDSRITAPKKHIHMNIASIKGGITDNAIVGELLINDLEEFKLVQELKNYVCFSKNISAQDKFEMCEFTNRLTKYYGFKNVSSDVEHQNIGRKTKYIDLIEKYIDNLSKDEALKDNLFNKDEKIDIDKYCLDKKKLFERIKAELEK